MTELVEPIDWNAVLEEYSKPRMFASWDAVLADFKEWMGQKQCESLAELAEIADQETLDAWHRKWLGRKGFTRAVHKMLFKKPNEN